MEKSMVHQLTSLNTSTLFNRTSFLTTAFNDTQSELTKSKIRNLPSYRKENLSTKLDFVVVFQAIEIQRLSFQIEALRVALRDNERQSFNVHNYEVQIRELTEKCHDYQEQISEYCEENEKMNIICERLYQELANIKESYADIDPGLHEKYTLASENCSKLEEQLQKWRSRYLALEASKNKELQNLRYGMENQRKSMINREMNEVELKFNSERMGLQQQIRRLQECLTGKQTIISQLDNKISQLQIVTQQSSVTNQRIQQYENKFAMISQQTMRLSEVLRNKQQEIDQLRQLSSTYQIRVKALEAKIQQQQECQSQIEKMKQSIKGWEDRLEEERYRTGEKLRKIYQYESKFGYIGEEIEMMKEKLRQKIIDVEYWKQKYNELLMRVEELPNQQHSEIIKKFQNKVSAATNQNERLSQIIKERTVEIQKWKNQHMKATNRGTPKQQQLLEKQKLKLQSTINQYIGLNNAQQSKCNQYQTQIRQLRSELQNQRRGSQYQRQINRLNNLVEQSNAETEAYRRKCRQLQQRSNHQLAQEISLYQQKQIHMIKEIDRINEVIRIKSSEISSLKENFSQMNKSISQYHGIEEKLINTMPKMEQLMIEVDKYQRQSNFYQEKLSILERDYNNRTNEIFMMKQEQQKSLQFYHQKSKDNQRLQYQISHYREQLNALKTKQMKYQLLQEKQTTYLPKIKQLQSELSRERYKSESLSNDLNSASERLSKIQRQGTISPEFRQQFDQVKKISEKKDREIRELQFRINHMENSLHRLKEANHRNHQISRRNLQKWANLESGLDWTAGIMKNMASLYDQILRLNEENLRLEGSTFVESDTYVEKETQNMKSAFFNFSKSNIKPRVSKIKEEDRIRPQIKLQRPTRVALEQLTLKTNYDI